MISHEELDARSRKDLKMALSYLSGFLRNLECSAGEHEWAEWSAHTCGNVAEMELLKENERFMYRACKHCGTEMPESRGGEKNYRNYEDVFRLCGECGHPTRLGG